MSHQSAFRHRLLLLALLLLGAALRLAAPGQAPPGLYHDEAYNGLDAVTLLSGAATNPLPLYFTANNGREPFYIYFVTLGVAVLGRTPLAVRLPAFFVGMLTLAATYDLARVLWGRRAGTLALAILSVTFWHVHLSRVGFRAVLLPLFTALLLAQGVRAWRDPTRKQHWIAAGAGYGLSWYTYIAARFTPVALAALFLYGWLMHRAATRAAWRGLLLFCAASLLVLAPLGLYTLRHPEEVLRRSGQVSLLSPEVNGGDLPGALLRHTLRTVGMFFVQGDRIWRHNLALRPVWEPGLGLAFLIGVGVALSQARRDPRAALPLLWTAVMAIPTLLAEDAPHFLRGVGVLPTAVLFPTLGLLWLADRLAGWRWARLAPALILLGATGSTAYDYFGRFAAAPQTYHWFEAGPAALAGQINTLTGAGWDGRAMRHGPLTQRTIYIDAALASPETWAGVAFLLPRETVRFFPVTATQPLTNAAFVVWPYRDWEPDVLPHLPHPAYFSLSEGPQAQGDKDPAPFTTALILRAAPRPAVPTPQARFEQGLLLRAALVASTPSGAEVRLWWDAEQTPAAPYTVFVHYLRAGERIAQDDSQPAKGHLPTTLWQAGDLILDAHLLPGVTPDPAQDSLRVGLYHSDALGGLSVLDAAGNPAAPWADLGVTLTQ